MMSMAFMAFPDYHESVEDIISEGDKIWILLRYSGTHKGDFMGLSPTGKQVSSLAVDMYRIEDGKIVWGKRVPTPDLAFLCSWGLWNTQKRDKHSSKQTPNSYLFKNSQIMKKSV